MTNSKDVDLFTEALRLAESERGNYLSVACGGNEELRRRVEKLLRAFNNAGDFLGQPAAGMPSPNGEAVPPIEEAGSRVGRYKLLQQIGEGGCGVVFMAEQQEPVRRTVAFKVIKPGMDTKTVIARFEAERQALALMDHPNIAHVFDAGTTASGRPYFVMELVRGLKITEHCDQKGLSTAERLDLFIQVCGAVQHAHQKGVIHRDLKPSNILITTSPDGKATPKVIDFGIAKATSGQRLTDKTLFTAFEMLVGTPAYMSPEQAELTSIDVDTRSDIYSLGVLLYELLTGTIPFDTQELLKSGLDEVRRVIRTQDPVRPSTRLSTMAEADLTTVSKHRHIEPPRLIREVRGDLDWIVMKAMEKDRNRRYATANGLALDVERFLEKEVVLARPPSPVYKLRKLIQRNKLAFIGLSLIFLLLVVALAVTSRLLIVQRRAVQLSDALQWESKATEFVLESKPEDAEGAFRNSLEIRRRYLDGEPPAPSTTRMVLDCLTTHDKLNVANELLDQILTPSVLSRQEYSDLCRYRAELCGRLGQWRAAAAMAIGFLNHQPEDHLAYHTLAPLYVVTTNLEAYHQLCLRIVSTFSNTTDLFIADRMAKDCLILPSAGVDLQLVAAMAQLAVVKGKGNETEFFFLSCDALAQYRLGNYEKSLDQANRTILFKNDMARAEAFAVMAMAQYRLGNVATALQALTNCNETIENKLAKIGQPPGPDWRDWIIARALRSEAESLIKPELWMRIEERGRLGHWQEAAVVAEHILEAQPDYHLAYHTLAPLYVVTTNLNAYHQLCLRIISTFSNTTDMFIADRMAKDCLILPSAGVDLQPVAAMAQLAITKGKGSGTEFFFQICDALAQYRLGNYETALGQATRSAGFRVNVSQAEAFSIMAMAQYRLGNAIAAQQALTNCNEVIKNKLAKIGDPPGEDWRDWIIAHALQNEANDLINQPRP